MTDSDSDSVGSSCLSSDSGSSKGRACGFGAPPHCQAEAVRGRQSRSSGRSYTRTTCTGKLLRDRPLMDLTGHADRFGHLDGSAAIFKFAAAPAAHTSLSLRLHCPQAARRRLRIRSDCEACKTGLLKATAGSRVGSQVKREGMVLFCLLRFGGCAYACGRARSLRLLRPRNSDLVQLASLLIHLPPSRLQLSAPATLTVLQYPH